MDIFTEAEKEFMADEMTPEKIARYEAARANLTPEQQLNLDDNVATIVRWVSERHPGTPFDRYHAMELLAHIGAWFVRRPKEVKE